MTPDDAKHLKPGDPVRYQEKPFNILGVVTAATSWKVSIQWKDHIGPLDYNPKDMASIHRRKREGTTV